MNDLTVTNSNTLTIDNEPSLTEILRENKRRLDAINAPFNPLTGEASIGKRKKTHFLGFPSKLETQWLPIEMLNVPLVKHLVHYGLDKTTEKVLGAFTPEARDIVLDQFIRIRYKYDFAFWCWMVVKIKPKGFGDDIPFRLNYPQRKLVEQFEEQRKAGKPVRTILLKARQWGGSTVTQIYMAWLQLVLMKGANSIIVGHVKDASTEVKDMFFKLLDKYPAELLTTPNDPNAQRFAKLPKIHGTSSSANLFYIDSRNCKLKLGSAERPESARGGDSTLAHCTEVAMWVATEGKTPEDIVRSVTGGISYKQGTMIVYESTANSEEGFFHDEYCDSKNAKELGKPHQFEPLFISWFEIGWKNMLPFKNETQYLMSSFKGTPERKDPYLPDSIHPDAPSIEEFAEKLIRMRNQAHADTDREEPGRYLWWLWSIGAPLQAIYWYTIERTKFHDHADMATEAPSDDIEAFKHSGARVFSEYHIHQFECMCKPPRFIGEVDTTLIVTPDEFNQYRHRPNEAFNGKKLISNLKFHEDPAGNLWVWDLPEYFDDCKITNRYIVSVDIGGMSNKADFSVILVMDRYWLTEGGVPVVVAQWYGHIDHDVLAIKAAQIAAFYDNALLVIESNTLETRDKDRDVDGDQSGFILNQIKAFYPNLYERAADPTNILEGAPRRLGFHTNTKTKPLLISNLQKCLRDKLYVERDKRRLAEYMVYQKLPNGSMAAARGHHDDLLMAAAISLYISYNEMDYPRVIEKKQHQLSGSKPIYISSGII